MNLPLSISWSERNQAYLVAEFARLRLRLGGKADAETLSPISPPAAIDTLAAIFNLSRFEREVLLLCAGVEMESAIAERCVEASGAGRSGAPTFGLAISALAEPHWSALAPDSPLRRYRLIEMELARGVTSAPLRIDERILHYIAGVNAARFAPHSDPARDASRRADGRRASPIGGKPGSARARRTRHGAEPLWGRSKRTGGDRGAGRQRAGRTLYVIRIEEGPTTPAELDLFVQLWTREAALLPACLLLQWEGDNPSETARRLAERAPGPLFIASREPLRLRRHVERRDVAKPGPAEQKRLWSAALNNAPVADSAEIDAAAQQFRFSAETIGAIGARLARLPQDSSGALWRACRSSAIPRMSHLAERIVPTARWENLVLPPLQSHLLRQLVGQTRQRMRVYEDWGFAAKDKRGLGASALFFGPSGTGKTLAAEVLAARSRTGSLPNRPVLGRQQIYWRN